MSRHVSPVRALRAKIDEYTVEVRNATTDVDFRKVRVLRSEIITIATRERGLETPRRSCAVEALISLGYKWNGEGWTK